MFDAGGANRPSERSIGERYNHDAFRVNGGLSLDRPTKLRLIRVTWSKNPFPTCSIYVPMHR